MQHPQFDYIIIGGGSADCVLANRLTENPGHRVCLLEAGPADRSPFIGIPGAFAYFMFSKKHNWMFESEPVEDIRKGQPVFCPQGKTLGGGSAINAMIYIRGHRSDYDHWAALGNRGWGFDDLLPYFDFQLHEATNEALRLNPELTVMPLSAASGEGFDRWIAYLRSFLSNHKG